MPITDFSVGREAVLSFKLDRLEEQVDMYWRQRAHVNWMQKGDQNTAFFHHCCSERRRVNRIGKLMKENGGWVEEEKEEKEFITNHFSQLFRSNGPGGQVDVQRLLDVVTREMNKLLTNKEFTAEEIRQALDSIGDLKAPGPDGLLASFFKNFWDVVGDKVTREV